MLDINYIREHAEEVKTNCANRRTAVDIDHLLSLDHERRERIGVIDALRSQRKSASKGKPSPEEIAALRKVGDEIDEKEKSLEKIDQELHGLLMQLPNLTHPDAPIGSDESGNRVVRMVGEIPKFSFQPKEHFEIGEALGVIDTERAAQVSGSRFAYIKGDLALIEFALIQMAMSVLTDEKTLKKIIKNNKLSVSSKPFIPVLPPVMIRPDVMSKMGRLEPREERYHIPGDDLYLIGSAEHTLGPLHMGETIPEENLPIRYIGFSTAFRREAGSYGKDMKGMFRMHQFDKLEMESFTPPEQSVAEQDFLIALQEHFMQLLEIPYQVVFKCTGDMGLPDYREFDIEAYLPGQGKYRETHTADLMTDYQSRRLNIKVKRADGHTEYLHMNDATALAMSRTPVAILENYQQADGSILIPKILQAYVEKKKISV